MKEITVTTKVELEEAVKAKAETIVVEGDLAKQVHRSRRVRTLSAATLVLLGAAIAAAPFTGGVSLGVSLIAAAPIAATTGVSVYVVIALILLGFSLACAIWGDYDEFEYQAWPPRLRLKRKRS